MLLDKAAASTDYATDEAPQMTPWAMFSASMTMVIIPHMVSSLAWTKDRSTWARLRVRVKSSLGLGFGERPSQDCNQQRNHGQVY